ncbi:transcriptional repressor gene korB [Bartonella sp. F02]|uniref:transcriptional repressor gene korB n=1 Tax=Bartonella sp. F02 TaxID=2967262 RepID=UPI0022A90BA2|nr:ParB/RepB/Spo0J family partition protein [Bartonella sp. F02]MCZ2328952.1 ParB/RepB/Spo0J family partition protein [Bartonella sp. F02]
MSDNTTKKDSTITQKSQTPNLFLKSTDDGPLNIPLNLIDEDPNQPRTENNPGFSRESLKELAATIRLRGVKTPISVRKHPKEVGRFIVNHGARRLRASKLAGKDTIPAFIDQDYNEVDQVIENLQRNELTAREIADFIGRELAKGVKKADIAKNIGKSPAFVTQYATLLDLPKPIAEAFHSGRVRDITIVNELVKLLKKEPDEVNAWFADDSQEFTRGSFKILREFLDQKHLHKTDNNRDPNTIDVFTGKTDTEIIDGEDSQRLRTNIKEKKQEKQDYDKLKKVIVQVEHDGRPARLMLNRRPVAKGYAWLKYDDDNQEFEVDLTEVQLVSLIEG